MEKGVEGLISENNESFPHEDDQIVDFREKFHNTVRENIIFLLFFLTLLIVSYNVIGTFLRKKDRDNPAPLDDDDDESVVYRICFWICVFSLSISIGATLLLPLSIVSNEVLLIYPKTYYVQWLNGMLISGLWNLIFLFANISLFILLPFAYLFIESEGFSGQKKGIVAKFYETVVILSLVGFTVWGIAYVLAACLGNLEEPGFSGLFILSFINQLPFIYSCISFFGVILLLVCTPLGFARLFTVLSQLLVGPQFLRNLDEEVLSLKLEISSIKSKLEGERLRALVPETETKSNDESNLKNGGSAIKNMCLNTEFLKRVRMVKSMLPRKERSSGEIAALANNLSKYTKELVTLEKMQKTPGWKRNILYPLLFMSVIGLTAIAVLMVVLNTLQLLVGIKSLPVSAAVQHEFNQTISLGLASISILGSWGAALEVVLIFYLISTSLIGLYMIPGIRSVRPQLEDSPTSHIIYNCALVLILSSALPLLARILGITNFDLLGNYGRIEWLGNFWIVVSYNLVFCIASILCLINKFTSAIRQEIMKRLRIGFRFKFSVPYDNSGTNSSAKGKNDEFMDSYQAQNSQNILKEISNLKTD